MNRARLIKVLIRHEGMRFKPYYDKTGKIVKSDPEQGKITIGVGRNLEDVGISKDEAIYMLNNDIDVAIRRLDHIFPDWKKLDDVRQEVLINMCFNLGNKLTEFKKFLQALKKSDYDKASEEMKNSLWCKQVKRRCDELVYAMKYGKYPFEINIEEDKILDYLNNKVWRDINEGW